MCSYISIHNLYINRIKQQAIGCRMWLDIYEHLVKYMDCTYSPLGAQIQWYNGIIQLSGTIATVQCRHRLVKEEKRRPYRMVHAWICLKDEVSDTNAMLLLLLIHNYKQRPSEHNHSTSYLIYNVCTHTHSPHNMMLCTQNHRFIRIATINDASVYLDLSLLTNKHKSK